MFLKRKIFFFKKKLLFFEKNIYKINFKRENKNRNIRNDKYKKGFYLRKKNVLKSTIFSKKYY